MKIEILTLFPEMFTVLNASITGRAQESGALHLQCHNLRDFARDRHRTVDDVPFGGEPGMVLKPEPLKLALSTISLKNKFHCIFMTPQGRPFSQKTAKKLAAKKNILIICGHYKGIDERIRQQYVQEEISIGDYVLTGGELAAMVVIDCIARLLPGVVGDMDSLKTDSFFKDMRLGWPVYTRPADFEGHSVPKVLLSGHHKNIQKWRMKAGLERTKINRPELFKQLKLAQNEKDLLNTDKNR